MQAPCISVNHVSRRLQHNAKTLPSRGKNSCSRMFLLLHFVAHCSIVTPTLSVPSGMPAVWMMYG
ncbi:hypothetical protein FLA_0714 [Filimonas lacunae]|nr:hypothetical protein FLA_0714 [Filimonas lacunae]